MGSGIGGSETGGGGIPEIRRVEAERERGRDKGTVKGQGEGEGGGSNDDKYTQT